MAWLRELPPCYVCTKPATVEILNRCNAVMGRYCTKHGKEALVRTIKEENNETKS